MAKKRMIHRSLWKSETLAACDMTTRLLFIGIVTNADDQGRLQSHPALLRSEIFPFDDIALKTIEHGLRRLEEQKSLICYTAGGKALVQVAHWWEYQQPRWAWPSDLPAPSGWTDRIRYRQGNNVIESNWPRNRTSASPEAPPEPAGGRRRRARPEPGRRARPPATGDPVGAAVRGCPDPGSEATMIPARAHGEARPEPRRRARPEPTAGPIGNPLVTSGPSGSGSDSGRTSGGQSNSSRKRQKARAGPRSNAAAAENADISEGQPSEHIEGACSEVPPESIEGHAEEAYHALLAFGIDGAAEIAAAYDGDDILAWLRYAKDKRDDLANPQGLVVRRLQQGRKPPPAYYENPEDWRRFTNGDYADYLETCPEVPPEGSTELCRSRVEGPVEGTCPEVPPEGSTELCRSLDEGPAEGDTS